MKINNKINLLPWIIVVILIFSNIAIYYVMNSKINKLTELKDNLEIQDIDLKNQLNSSQAIVEQRNQEFQNYRDVLKKWVSLSKVIRGDVGILATTARDYYDETSTDYTTNKIIVDRYESELTIFKRHIVEYKKLLEDNKEVFEWIGLDIDVEINTLDSGLPEYEDQLKTMKNFISSLKR